MSATVTQSIPANSAAESTSPSSILLHPHSYDPAQFDAETRRLLVATIKWFEQRGLRQLLEDFHAKRYYTEFLEFLAKEKVLATFLTPAQNADGNPGKRWDTARISALSEITRFLRPQLLVPVPGLDPWARPGLAERKRCGSEAGSRRA